jgi:tripartite-type tricarboxylate transporter receptor subunit TctC
MLNLPFRVLAAATVFLFAPSTFAQNYPAQNVNVIVAFPAGGLADIPARLISTKLGDRVKQNFVVENRGGAGGNIAAKAVASAEPDGYTLLATTSALAVNATASKNKGYDTNDLRAVAIVGFSPDVLAVHPSNPAKNLKEFVANAQKESFNYGSAGVGTGPYIGAEYFFGHVAKVKYVQVPFQGGAPAINAVLGNHVNAIVLTLPPVTPHIVSGKLRGLAIASDKRVAAIPNVPTYAEQGYPDFFVGSWVGFFAPAKTPDAVVAKLNAEIGAVMKEADTVDKLTKAGFQPLVQNVAEADAYFKKDVAQWGKMVTAIGFSN